MNRFPSKAPIYGGRSSPPRALHFSQYGSSNFLGGGMAATPPQFYQSGPSTSSSSSSSGMGSVWQQQPDSSLQSSAQYGVGNGQGYGGGGAYQHQQPQAYRPPLQIGGNPRQQHPPNVYQQYNVFQQQNYYGGQQGGVEGRQGFLHQHPYQRPSQSQNAPPPPQLTRRTTGFLEQLLEKKPASLPGQGQPGQGHPYRRGMGGMPPGPRPGLIRAVGIGQQRGSLPVNGAGTGTGGVPANGERLRALLKAKSGERFQRNEQLLDAILDEKVVEAQSNVVTGQRLGNLRQQVDILQGELAKQEKDVEETKESCERRLEEFRSSSDKYNKDYNELCGPIPQKAYQEMVDKHLNDLQGKDNKDKPSCDCGEEEKKEPESDAGNPKLERVTPVTPGGDGEGTGEEDEEEPDLQIIGEVKPKQIMREGYGAFRSYGNGSGIAPGPGPDGFFRGGPTNNQFFDAPPPPPQYGHYEGVGGGVGGWGYDQTNPYANFPPEFLSPGGNRLDYPLRAELLMGPSAYQNHNQAQAQAQYPNHNQSQMQPMWHHNGPRAPMPMPAQNQAQNFGRAHQPHPHPPPRSRRELRQRPSEELRNFLIKLVKEKCQQEWSGGADPMGEEMLPRRAGLFCGGGIMEVNRGQPPPPMAPAMQLPPSYDWLGSLEELGKIEENSGSVGETGEGQPEFEVAIKKEGDEEPGKTDSEGMEGTVPGGQVLEDENKAGSRRQSQNGTSKLAELLERPCLNNGKDLKRVEIALDSEHKFKIDTDGDGDGSGKDNSQSEPERQSAQVWGNDGEELEGDVEGDGEEN